MNFVISILIMLMISSCTLADRKYLYYPKQNAPREVTTDKTFLKNAESYGAFYNYHFSSKEYSVKGRWLVATFIIHRQIVILNESGYDYAKIEIPDLNLVKNLKITITYGNGSIKQVKTNELTDVLLLKDDNSKRSYKNYFYNVPDVSANTLIDYSYEYEIPTYAIIERDFWDFEIPIKYIEQKIHSYKRGDYQTSTFNDMPYPSKETLEYSKVSYTFADRNLYPKKDEAYALTEYYTTPYFIWSIVNSEKGNTNTQWAYLLSYTDPEDRPTRSLRNFSEKVMATMDLSSKSFANDLLKEILKTIKIDEDLDSDYQDLDKMLREKKTTNYGIFRLFINILALNKVDYELIFAKSYKFGEQNFEHPSFFEVSDLYLKLDGQFFNSDNMAYAAKFLDYSLYNTNAISYRKKLVNSIRLHDAMINDHQVNIDVNLSLSDLNNHSISVKEKQSGVLAILYDSEIESLKDDESEIKEFVQNHINSNYSNMSLTNYHYDFDKEKVELNLKMDIDVKDYVQDLGHEKIIQFGQFIPNNFSDLLDLSERESGFDFNIKHHYNVNFKMLIPDGYKAELPDLKELKSNNDYFKQDYTLLIQDNKVIVNYKSSIKERIVPIENKKLVEKFVQNIIKIKSSQLLISKI